MSELEDTILSVQEFESNNTSSCRFVDVFFRCSHSVLLSFLGMSKWIPGLAIVLVAENQFLDRPSAEAGAASAAAGVPWEISSGLSSRVLLAFCDEPGAPFSRFSDSVGIFGSCVDTGGCWGSMFLLEITLLDPLGCLGGIFRNFGRSWCLRI